MTKYFVCSVFEITEEEFGEHPEEREYFRENVLNDLILHSNFIGDSFGKFKEAWVMTDD